MSVSADQPDLELLLRRIIREEGGVTAVAPAEEWRGGTMVLKLATARRKKLADRDVFSQGRDDPQSPAHARATVERHGRAKDMRSGSRSISGLLRVAHILNVFFTEPTINKGAAADCRPPRSDLG